MIKVESKWSYSGDIEEDLDGVVGRRADLALRKLGDLLNTRIKKKLSRRGSGRIYPSKLGGGRKHQASAPGEAPAPDTKGYLNSMYVRVFIFKRSYRMEFRSDLWEKFGRRLELGGWGGHAYIAPRPHIRPVWEQSLGEIQQILDDL